MTALAIAPDADDVVAFTLDGRPVRFAAHPETVLADLLREEAGITATKIGCRVGRCGACTVLVDGVAVNGCLVPAHRLEGATVVTPDGLDALPVAAVVRAALTEGNAFQCGYCAPGIVTTVVALLTADRDPDEAAVRAALAGHICRCTGYGSIVRAVLDAAARLKEARP